MKKSIRIIGGMLAVTTTLLTLASCKASPSGKDDDDTFGGNGGKTVVRYYSFNDEQSNKELKAAIEADFYKKIPISKFSWKFLRGISIPTFSTIFRARTKRTYSAWSRAKFIRF